MDLLFFLIKQKNGLVHSAIVPILRLKFICLDDDRRLNKCVKKNIRVDDHI
jgi:hypothetical protein